MGQSAFSGSACRPGGGGEARGLGTLRTESRGTCYNGGMALSVDHLRPEDYDPALYSPKVTVEPIADWSAWTPNLDEQYRELGFVSVGRAFAPSICEGVGDALLQMIADGPPEGVELQYESLAGDVTLLEPEARQDFVRKFMWFVRFDDRFRTMAYDPQLLSVVERLLGAKPEMFQEMALFKPPGIGREKPWHQDHAYFNVAEGTRVVGVWIALDDATLENGCMVFQPAGHRSGPIPHFQRRDWQICDADVLRFDATVAAPVRAGGCLVFDGLTPHGTPMNRSTKRRRAIQFHYVAKGTPRTTTEERMRLFGEEGRDVSC